MLYCVLIAVAVSARAVRSVVRFVTFAWLKEGMSFSTKARKDGDAGDPVDGPANTVFAV
jgi:hypothetical protein